MVHYGGQVKVDETYHVSMVREKNFQSLLCPTIG